MFVHVLKITTTLTAMTSLKDPDHICRKHDHGAEEHHVRRQRHNHIYDLLKSSLLVVEGYELEPLRRVCWKSKPDGQPVRIVSRGMTKIEEDGTGWN